MAEHRVLKLDAHLVRRDLFACKPCLPFAHGPGRDAVRVEDCKPLLARLFQKTCVQRLDRPFVERWPLEVGDVTVHPFPCEDLE